MTDDQRRDLELLAALILNKQMMVADDEHFYQVLMKMQMFTVQYHRSRNIKISDEDLPLTFSVVP